MGLWDTVSDVADSVADAAGEFVDDAKKFLDGVGGLGQISKGIDLTDVLGTTLSAAGLGYATSPPLLLGQLQIDAMKLTMGFGPPENADDLETSVAELEDAGDVLVNAQRHDDRWDGSASQAYDDANSEHLHQTLEIADADKVLHAEIGAQAEDVGTARRLLQDKWDFLSDYDTATDWMSRVPGLGQAKMAADMAVAAEQTTEARITTAKLAWDTFERASRVNAIRAKYQGAAGETFPEDFGQCGDPFGDEHRPGQNLPSRTHETTPWTVPDPGPLPTPPATPYEMPTPGRVSGSGPTPAPAPTPVAGVTPAPAAASAAVPITPRSSPPPGDESALSDSTPHGRARTGAQGGGLAPIRQNTDGPRNEPCAPQTSR